MSLTTEKSEEEAPRMPEIKVSFTPDQWGPCELPKQFGSMPYQQFNKNDRLGKICDWTKPPNIKKNVSVQTSLKTDNQYSYFHDEDESTFRLVDTTRVQKPAYQRGRFQRTARGGYQTKMQVVSKGAKGSDKNYQNKRWGKKLHIIRDATVIVKPDWVTLQDMEFSQLGKLSLPGVKQGEDILCCGEMKYYNKAYDRINVKNEKLLQSVDCVFHTVTTTDDPNIRQLSKTEGNVFATDAILATLMCSTRSKYSWDIVIEKVNNKIFFDKRDNSEFDLLTVNETSAEQPDDDGNTINSARNLAIEATFINQNFSQQVLHSGPKESRFKFDNPNPFVSGDEEEEVASVGYRYRKWDLGAGIILVVRCENDAVIRSPTGEVQYLTVKALNEWDMKSVNGVEWRQKLDTQRSAVIASELRNNACKLAKWTVQALLAGSNQIKFGYVSRVNFRENRKHVILGTQQYKPSEFAAQIKLNMDNAWGILRCIVDKVMQQKDGKYLIMRDPNKSILRLYDVPDTTFESASEDEI